MKKTNFRFLVACFAQHGFFSFVVVVRFVHYTYISTCSNVRANFAQAIYLVVTHTRTQTDRHSVAPPPPLHAPRKTAYNDILVQGFSDMFSARIVVFISSNVAASSLISFFRCMCVCVCVFVDRTKPQLAVCMS